MEVNLFVFIIRRLIFNLLPVLIGATTLTFFIVQSAPGDFLDARRLDPRTTKASIERFERQFGLDKPVVEQYFIWFKNLFTGNLGLSFDYNRPVTEVMAKPIQNSFTLVIAETILLWLVAVPVGVYSAVRQYSLGDKVVSIVSYFFLGFPSFFFGLIFIYLLLQYKFATGNFLLPLGGMTSPEYDSMSSINRILDVAWHVVAPLLTATAVNVAGFTRSIRGQMLEFISHDYVRTARSKGLSERVVIYKHALRNALVPFIATIGGTLPAMVAGAGFVEVVFSWPGITPMMLNAINSQDLYLFVGSTVITVFLLIIGNLISDLLLAAVDPRIRYG